LNDVGSGIRPQFTGMIFKQALTALQYGSLIPVVLSSEVSVDPQLALPVAGSLAFLVRRCA
jgi:hypothetical protein